MDNTTMWLAIAAVIPVTLTGIFAGLSIGKATSKAVESAARQPEAANNLLKILILGASLIEATAIYALLVGLILIFRI